MTTIKDRNITIEQVYICCVVVLNGKRYSKRYLTAFKEAKKKLLSLGYGDDDFDILAVEAKNVSANIDDFNFIETFDCLKNERD